MRLNGVRTLAAVVAASLLVSLPAAAQNEEPETLIRQGLDLRRRRATLPRASRR